MKPNIDSGKFFDGRWYIADGKGYYYNSHTRKRLHQAVWIKYNGPIPKGYEIHHKDLNKENNDISNLQCLTKAEHLAIHAALLTEEDREWRRDNLNENARPKAIDWHRSEAGKAWHKQHIKQQIDKGQLNKKIEFECSYCGKKFESIARNLTANHFCSNNCKARFLRKKRAEDKSEKRVCCICGKEYMASPWSSSSTCSCSCACKLRSVTLKDRGQ